MSLWWGIKGCRCLTFSEARQILSGFAYGIYSDYFHDIWQNKETGSYTLVQTRFDWGARVIEKILDQGMTLEQLESKLCNECPFYGEPGEEEKHEYEYLEESSG